MAKDEETEQNSEEETEDYSEEESSLVDEIESSEEPESMSGVSFNKVSLDTDSTLVLEEVQKFPGARFTLEDVASEASVSTSNNDKKNPHEYIPKQNEEEEKKYIQSSATMTSQFDTFDPSRIGRDLNRPIREINPDDFSEIKSNSSQDYEIARSPERTDVDNLGRRNPFERENKKYDPSLPKH